MKQKKKIRNQKSERKCYSNLSMVLNANREVAKYKQLLGMQKTNAQIFERRMMLEKLDGDYYADLLEWISDYIFLQNWKDENLMRKIEEYRAYRHRAYEKLLVEQEKLRKLEINTNGRKKFLDVYS